MPRLRFRPAIYLALLLVASGALGTTSEPAIALGDDLELQRLDDGLWLYRATIELNGRPVASNGLVIVGPRGATVIDTPWNDELTARLVEWTESRLGEVAAVVVTHFHADRLGGIAEVRRRGVVSYGHLETARLAVANGLPTPEVAFETRLTLSTGTDSIEVFYPGPGHSPDNAVVWLADREILFGGCLLKSTEWSSLGFLGDAIVESWGPSLESLLERYPLARIVIPGHGAVGDLGVVRHTLDLVRQHRERDSDR